MVKGTMGAVPTLMMTDIPKAFSRGLGNVITQPLFYAINPKSKRESVECEPLG